MLKNDTFAAILEARDDPRFIHDGLCLTTQAAADLVRAILPNIRVRVPDRPNDRWFYDLSDGWSLELRHWPPTPFTLTEPILARIWLPKPDRWPPTYVEDGMIYRVPIQLEVETDEDYAKLLLHFIPAEKVRQFLAQGARG
jgi:hypothetical protein